MPVRASLFEYALNALKLLLLVKKTLVSPGPDSPSETPKISRVTKLRLRRSLDPTYSLAKHGL